MGRLDADATGALLLTNDGELANRLAHPRYGVEKVYEAEIEGVPDAGALASLRTGASARRRRVTAPARVRILGRPRAGARRSVLELALHEGRNRQVKRMCEAVGHPVRRLHRTRYAGLGVDDLAPGDWRPLSPAEIERLRSRP